MTNRYLFALVLVALAVGCAAALLVSSGAVLSLLTQAVNHALLAIAVGTLLRQNGMASFGHALFSGAAGYGVGLLLKLQLLPAEWAIAATLVALMLSAFIFGLVIVRVPGIAFGMLTLAIGQMFFLTALRARGVTGGADGMHVEWPATLFGVSQSVLLKPANLFLLCWTVLVGVMVALTLLLRGRFGAITEAVRDNEERARFIGITTVLPRAAVYALTALVAGIAGVLSALNSGFVSPEGLHWSISGMALLMAIVGGYKTLWGPPLGAIAYFLVKDVLGDYASHWMAIFGVALITVIVFSPTGLAGALQRLAVRCQPRAGAVRSATSIVVAAPATVAPRGAAHE